MLKKSFENICDTIAPISPYIRFVGVIGESGDLQAYKRRADLVPLLDENTVLLVREYAAGIDEYNLSLPKGLIEEGEDIFQAANREMMEEIGFGAHDLTELKSMSSAPGYLKGKMSLVLAKNLYEKRLAGDEPEDIEVVPWKLSEIDKLLEREDFTEARSIAALYMVRELIEFTPT